MRSGQYKLVGAGLRGTDSQVTVGHFRSSQSDLLPAESPVSDFPHMNSLVVTKSKLSDSRPINKSCENLSSTGGTRSAVTRVEQRVKSLLQRGDSRPRNGHDAAPAATAEDVWQYGHVVTLPRRPRLSLALSHSALHHLSSDTASCISASSGYSSSSSSSYGSFKSSTSSSCSTLPRKKSRSECGGMSSEGDMPPPLTRSCTLVDNPMYDVTPATDPRTFNRNKSPKRRSSPSPRHEPIYDLTPDSDPYSLDTCDRRRRSPSTHDPIYDVIPGGDPNSSYHRESRSQGHDNHLYDLVRPSRLLTPDSGTHGGLDSLEESALDSLDCSDPQNGMLEEEMVKEEDQVAKECREYFERRLKNSETLKKRWSMCSSDSGADSGDSDLSPTSHLTSAGPPSIASNTSSTSTASNTSSSTTQVNASTKKTPLDQKMEFLRKEIASLMNQDNALFRQLLTLHESISALKTTPAHAHRAPSPTSLDSFTEEEEEEDEEEDDEDDQVGVGGLGEKTGGGREENLSDVDEGLELDHSTSPTSTLSSNSSRDSQFLRYSSKTEYHQPNHNVIKLPSNASQSSIKTSTANNSICTTNDTSMKYINCSSSSNLKENDDDCGTTNITNFTSNKKSRRYSITTNEDFNINITINSDDSSSFSNSSSQRSISTSCLSKSSCYISTTDPNTCDLEMDKTFGGSLGSFCPPEGRHFVRTRVSIPPSARNRDRSARPESFRISSDMATHTRVLLKARSFAGASLRESPTHKKNGRRNFARTSLREDQLTYHRDKGYNHQNAMSKMEFLRARFASTSGTASDSNSCEASSDDCVVINSRPYFGAYVKPDDEYYGPEPADIEAKIVNVRTEELQTSLKTTNIVTVSSTTPEEYIECTKDSWNHGNLDSLRQGGATIGNTFYVPSSDHYGDNINTTIKENTFSSSEPHPSPHTRTCNKESCSTTNQLTRKISLAVPDSYPCEDSQESLKSQKLRTRSFTGMVTPRETITENIQLPREVLNDHKTAKKGTLCLRVTQNTESERIFRVATMTRRARVTHDGYAFRFSSDLGLGTSSRVTPRSKREVFV